MEFLTSGLHFFPWIQIHLQFFFLPEIWVALQVLGKREATGQIIISYLPHWMSPAPPLLTTT
jgi:hypothetical protein